MLCCHQMYHCSLSTFELFLGRGGETTAHTESCVGSAGVLEEIHYVFFYTGVFHEV